MRQLTVILLLLLLSSPTFGEGSTQVDHGSSVGEQRKNYLDKATIYYRINESKVDPTYLTNSDALELVRKRLTDTESINHLDSITLMAKASPDGPVALNDSLSECRAEMLKQYLTTNYPDVEDKLRVGFSGEDWDGLRAMVVEDRDFPNKSAVLEFMDSDAELDVKEWRIKQLDGGKSWSYMAENILPYLRSGASAIFHYDVLYVEKYSSTQPTPQPDPVRVTEPTPILESEPSNSEQVIVEEATKPLFAIKTNLLYDAVTVLNVEAEVPIRNRWSIAGEWIFPWWSTCGNKSNDWQSGGDKSRNTLQILSGNIEGRYWFGDRTKYETMTGWNAGLYAGGGLYDLEYDGTGYQGEFFVAAGVSCGFAHTINKSGSLRMEYSLGFGYLKTNYRYYESSYDTIDDKWHPIRQRYGNYLWVGPTKLRASLVWMLNRKTEKGGNK